MENVNPDVRDKTVAYVTKHIDRAIRCQMEYRTSRFARCKQVLAEYCSLCCGKIYGNYLATLHLVTKILYVAGGVGQLFILGEFIGDGYMFYGVSALQKMLNRKYHNYKLFPRVTLCDIKLRQFSNIQQFTVQCALPINLFNEKVYLLLWFWLCGISLMNIYTLLSYLWNAFLPNRRAYVSRHLKIYLQSVYLSRHISHERLHDFVCNYLRQDGILVLQMIESNTNNVTIAEITGALWEIYRRQRKHKQRMESHNDLQLQPPNYSRSLYDVI